MESRERLIRTMGDVMWERGYVATSPREVRQRAGIGQGSMYHHFPTKRDLALAALERACAELLPTTENLLSVPGDPLEKLTAYLRHPRPALKGCKVGRMTQDPEVAADPGLLSPVADAFERVHRGLARVIGDAIAVGELSPTLNPERLAYLLMATIQGGYVLAIAAQDSRPFEDACAGALDLLLAAGPAAPLAPAPAGAAAPTERNEKR